MASVRATAAKSGANACGKSAPVARWNIGRDAAVNLTTIAWSAVSRAVTANRSVERAHNFSTPMKRKFWVPALLTALPLTLAAPLWSAASWRAEPVGEHPFALEKTLLGTTGTFTTSIHFKVLLSPDGRHLVSYSTGSTGQSAAGLAMWDLASKRVLWQQKVDGVFGWEPLCFSPSGAQLVMARNPGPNCCISDNGSRTVGIFEADSGVQTGALSSERPGFRFQSAAFSSDGKTLVTATDRRVLVWDVAAQKIVSRVEVPVARLASNSVISASIAVSPRGQLFAANWGNDFVKSADPKFRLEVRDAGGSLKWKMPNGGAPVEMIFSPDGKLLLTRARNAVYEVRNAATGTIIARQSAVSSPFTQAVWLPDSSAFLVESGENYLNLSAQTGVLTSRVTKANNFGDFAIAPDGDGLYSISNGGQIQRQRLR